MSSEKPRCRLCMHHKPYLATLFRRSLSMKVMELADVQVMENDGLPTVVCIDCENAVEKCYSFRTQIQWADKKFREEMSVSLVEVEECSIKEEHGDFMEDDSDLHSDRGHNDDAAKGTGDKGQDGPVIPLNHVEVMETIETGNQVQMIDDPQGQAEPLIEAPFAAKEEERAMDPLICTKEEDVSMESDTNSATSAPASTSDFPVKWKKPARPRSTSAAKTKPKKEGLMLSPQVHQEHSKLHRTLIAPPNRGSPFGQKSQELTLNVRGSVLHNTDSTKLGKYSRGGRPKCSCSKDKNTQPSHRSILKDATHSNVDKVKSHVPRRKIVNIAISGAFCRICNLECGSLGLLKEHLQKKELTCRVCLKKFNSHKALENHYFTHKKYSCLDCKEIFFDKKQLFMHRTALNHYSYQQECNMCGMKVLSHDSVPQPKTPFHLNGVPYFKCVVCAKEFALASSLKCHLQSYHTVYERIKCTVCKKKLSGPEKLITHMKISHSGSEKDLRPACAICGKKFSSNDDLKKHVDTHKCSICGVSIKGKTALKNHMNFSHPARAKCLFKHCNLEFDNVLALSRHSKKVHSNASAPLLETESRCEVCGKTFKTSLTMNGLCSDEKPVKCNICVVKFKHHFMMRSLKSY